MSGPGLPPFLGPQRSTRSQIVSGRKGDLGDEPLMKGSRLSRGGSSKKSMDAGAQLEALRVPQTTSVPQDTSPMGQAIAKYAGRASVMDPGARSIPPGVTEPLGYVPKRARPMTDTERTAYTAPQAQASTVPDDQALIDNLIQQPVEVPVPDRKRLEMYNSNVGKRLKTMSDKLDPVEFLSHLEGTYDDGQIDEATYKKYLETIDPDMRTDIQRERSTSIDER